jgi:hypothetical protein
MAMINQVSPANYSHLSVVRFDGHRAEFLWHHYVHMGRIVHYLSGPDQRQQYGYADTMSGSIPRTGAGRQ